MDSIATRAYIPSMPMMLLAFLASFTFYAQAAAPSIIGRWDITFPRPNGDRSGWLEVHKSGNSTLVGQFVATSGSARPISEVEFKDGEMRFAIPAQWERIDGKVTVVG